MKQVWEERRLGDFCENLDSKRIPVTQRDRITGIYPYYGATGILDYVNNYIFNEKLVLIGEDGAKWGSGEKSAFIVEGKYWVNNHAHVIKPDRSIVLDEWLVYYLNFCDLRIYTTGLTVPKLNQTKLNEILIPLPPLPEQRRIVAILDEAFAAIAKAKMNTEKNLQNAQEMFQSYLTNVLVNQGADWKEKKLGDICDIERGGSPRPISSFITDDPDGINWVKIGDTKGITKYIYQTKEKIKPEGARRSRMVHEGDFLLSNSMSFGRPYIMKTTGCIHDGWLVLREKVPNIDKDFLYYVLGSDLIFQQFDYYAAGSTVRNLNIDLVKKVTIPFPPLPEQNRIVAFLNALAAETQKLETIYRQKLADLEELKKSILQKAVEGEL